MKKNDKIKRKSNPVSKPRPVQPFDYAIWIFKNIIIGVVIYLAIFKLIEKQPSYNWAYNTLMKGNYDLIKQNDTLSLDQKWVAKLGYTCAYWNYLRDNTPEDAVILFPTHDIFMPEGKETQFAGEPAGKINALRFLYPRKVVLQNEIETNRYGKQITHVAIANGWGYEYLEYPANNSVANTVLPIKQPENIQPENQTNTNQ
ncbi:MAG: hypothetical protein LBL13_07325 [Bacteroidales bacterium]|jgi:hypothetical protein|nr:hypothetical protein [Bacteroidales bacterium]